MSYNGWTNYVTWRLWCEFFDGQVLGREIDGEYCRAIIEDYIDETAGNNIVADWARSFIEDANWDELAEHLSADEDA